MSARSTLPSPHSAIAQWFRDAWNLPWSLKAPFLGVLAVVFALLVTVTLIVAVDGGDSNTAVSSAVQPPRPTGSSESVTAPAEGAKLTPAPIIPGSGPSDTSAPSSPSAIATSTAQSSSVAAASSPAPTNSSLQGGRRRHHLHSRLPHHHRLGQRQRPHHRRLGQRKRPHRHRRRRR